MSAGPESGESRPIQPDQVAQVRPERADVGEDMSEILGTMAACVNNQVSGFAELASLLWRERANREQVLFKIVEEQLVLAAGQTRWLANAGREIEAALADLRRGEVVRAAMSGALAARLGLPGSTTLAELADAAPEPWDEILRAHCDALRELQAEIEEATSESQRLLEAVASISEPWPALGRLRSSTFAPMTGDAGA
jgi:hypothetical protein